MKGLADTNIDTGQVCLAPPYKAGQTTAEQNVAALVATARSLVVDFPSLDAILQEGGPSICLSDKLFSEHAYYDFETSQIVVSAKLTGAKSLAVLLHELRHADQFRVGACPGAGLSMQENARAVFAMEADANAVVLLVAWKHKANGDSALWDSLASWDNVADIAQRFAGVMSTSSDPADAAAAAFEQWYVSDTRREAYYTSSCMDYLDRNERRHALPSYQTVPPAFFETLCHMPDGEAYPCDEPERTERN